MFPDPRGYRPPIREPDAQDEEYELRSCETPLYNLEDKREAAIVAWCLLCFLTAGMPALEADVLAQRRDVDRVRVERLLAAGAPPALVLDIVL